MGRNLEAEPQRQGTWLCGNQPRFRTRSKHRACSGKWQFTQKTRQDQHLSEPSSEVSQIQQQLRQTQGFSTRRAIVFAEAAPSPGSSPSNSEASGREGSSPGLGDALTRGSAGAGPGMPRHFGDQVANCDSGGLPRSLAPPAQGTSPSKPPSLIRIAQQPTPFMGAERR